MPDYNVLVGLNYGPTDKRVEPGDVTGDLPPESVKWLVEQGHIELIELAPEPDADVADVADADVASEPEPAPAPAFAPTNEGSF